MWCLLRKKVPTWDRMKFRGLGRVEVGALFARGMRKHLHTYFWDALFQFKLGELFHLLWVKHAPGMGPLSKRPGRLGYRTIEIKISRHFPSSFTGEFGLLEMLLFSRKRPHFLI
jgi:hypothetical protein